MKKIKEPLQFSEAFGLDKEVLEQLGVLDPILNVDTKLFIDPMLLEASCHEEMRKGHDVIKQFFELIIKLLSHSQKPGDKAWSTAYNKFLFHEVSGTCIGYGSGIHGSGWGPVKARKVTNTAKEIITIGVKDPDLFMVIPLLEENIGPDLISDMVTNIILDPLLDFNRKVLAELSLPTEEFEFEKRKVELPVNPKEDKKSPVILLPLDVLRELPTANDWEEVCTVASENAQLRDQVSEFIGEIWKVKSKQQKSALREKALSSVDAFTALLDTLKKSEPRPYDIDSDPDGHFAWLEVRKKISEDFPLKVELPDKSKKSLIKFVEAVVEQYEWLIQDRGLSRLLWKVPNSKRVKESVAQMLFFAVADSYARANNIDITPEADMGRGSVDFKFSSGYELRALVEIKFSDHAYVVSGYEKQLEIYKTGERTEIGYYVVIDVGYLGKKDQEIMYLKNESLKKYGHASEFILIDGAVRTSASKTH